MHEPAVINGPFDVRFGKDAKIIIAGGSSSGKTTLAKRIIENADVLMSHPPKKIFYFYQMDQPIFKEIERSSKIPIEFIQGVPTEEKIDDIVSSPMESKMICLDDHGQHLNRPLANLFSVGSHHGSTQVLLLLQNFFGRNKYDREISLSATQIIFCRNIRDKTIIAHFARQHQPGHHKEFQKIYQEATLEPFSYLLVDVSQKTNDDLRYRSNIFPGEEMKVWVLKDRAMQIQAIL